MGRKEKEAYLEAIRHRYRKSARKQKAKILDEFCRVCGFNRKNAAENPATKLKNC